MEDKHIEYISDLNGSRQFVILHKESLWVQMQTIADTCNISIQMANKCLSQLITNTESDKEHIKQLSAGIDASSSMKTYYSLEWFMRIGAQHPTIEFGNFIQWAIQLICRSSAAAILSEKDAHSSEQNITTRNPREHLAMYTVEKGIGQIVEYKKGTYLYQQGEYEEYVYYVISGSFKNFSVQYDGREFAQSNLMVGETTGQVPIFTQTPHGSFCVAKETSTVLKIHGSKIKELVILFPEYAWDELQQFARGIRYYAWTSRILSCRGLREKIPQILLRDAYLNGIKLNDGGFVLTSTFTHAQIAEMLGVSRQNITIKLNELKKAGIIKIKNKQIIIYPSQDSPPHTID